MIIATDLDSTLSEFDKVWIERYNHDYNDELSLEAWISWDTHLYVKPECGYKIYDYFNDPQLYLDAQVREGAQEVVQGWLEHGHEVLVISSCVPSAYEPKAAWLKRHFPGIPKGNFIATSRKELIRADALIDDAFHNLVSFPGRRYLLDSPWNRVEAALEARRQGITVARDWHELGRVVHADLGRPPEA
jgi:5'(3')-deoxyribonucleotidase